MNQLIPYLPIYDFNTIYGVRRLQIISQRRQKYGEDYILTGEYYVLKIPSFFVFFLLIVSCTVCTVCTFCEYHCKLTYQFLV